MSDPDKEDIMPYSYHTFMYPFYWDKDAAVTDCVDKNPDWERVYLPKYFEGGENKAQSLLQYATYQYFSPKAGKLIFDRDEPKEHIIQNYRLRNISTENSFLDFYIDGNDYAQSSRYHLCVNQIRLELMKNLQIGVLILEAENYGGRSYSNGNRYVDALSGCTQKERLTEITKINDLGRRVFSPFLDGRDGIVRKGSEAPWKTCLIIKEPTDDRNIVLVDCTEKAITQKAEAGNLEIAQTPDGFEKLILGESEAQTMKLSPAVDDRMYVACCLGVGDFRPFHSVSYGRYAYQCSTDAAEELYRLVFLERGDVTCQNRGMLRQKLEDHVYPRWIQYGTVHGVTEYSMVCVTGCDSEGRLNSGLRPTVINPFLTEYLEMAKIALLQRAAAIRLEDEASRISRDMGLQSNNEDGNEERIEEIQTLWRKYLLFQSELLLPEVTFQEQGAELYDILKTSFRIPELSASLNTNMYNLHEMAEAEDAAIRRSRDREDRKSDNRLSRAVNLFSVMGISLALAGLVQDAMSYAGLSLSQVTGDHRRPACIFAAAEAVALGLELFFLYYMNSRILHDIDNDKTDKDKKDKTDKDKTDNDKKYLAANRKIWIGTSVIVIIAIAVQMFLQFRL